MCYTENTGIQTPEVLQTNDYYPFGMSMAIPEHGNQYKYNRKELYTDYGLDWYDYGARFYDAVLGRWHVIDPMCEISRRWTTYQYAYNNPIRFIDPDGMVVDDFYFNQDGSLNIYVENDEPDRVFVATGETTTDESAENPMLEPVYEQVEMSSTEVEQKMDDNGYKKVTKEKTVEVKDMTTFITDADGGNRQASKHRISSMTLNKKTKYIDKSKNLQNIQETHLYTSQPTKHKGTYMIETSVKRQNYNYERKDHKETVNKVVQFIFKIIGSFQ